MARSSSNNARKPQCKGVAPKFGATPFSITNDLSPCQKPGKGTGRSSGFGCRRWGWNHKRWLCGFQPSFPARCLISDCCHCLVSLLMRDVATSAAFSGYVSKSVSFGIIHCLYLVGIWNSSQTIPVPCSSGAPSSRFDSLDTAANSPSTSSSVGMTRRISAAGSGLSVCA